MLDTQSLSKHLQNDVANKWTPNQRNHFEKTCCANGTHFFLEDVFLAVCLCHSNIPKRPERAEGPAAPSRDPDGALANGGHLCTEVSSSAFTGLSGQGGKCNSFMLRPGWAIKAEGSSSRT